MQSPKIHPVLVYTDEEDIPGWWSFRFMSPTPQSASDVPQNTKKCGQKNTVCFTAVELEKNVTSSYIRDLLTADVFHYSLCPHIIRSV